MRWTALLFIPGLLGAAEIGGSNVRTVYITPMTHGLDQHVANRLTRDRVLEVVADPARADAILTDRLGEPLEYQLEKLHPTPKPPEENAVSDADKDADKDKDDSDKDASDTAHAPPPKRLMTNVEPRANAFGGGKGTVFLVDAHSRAILWSVYEKPKRTTPDQLEQTAKRVVNQLKQDLAGK